MPADIQASGLKPTLPRIQVLNAFHTSPERHLAAEDVYRLLLQGGVDLGLATVYRVLAQFEQAGLLKKSQLQQNKAVYELNDGEEHHGHFVCTATGAVREFHDPVIEERLRAIASEMGFQLYAYTLTAYGAPGGKG
ncbi:transcriptional repressor [Acidovorax sp. FG27]|uniref:Fur family transcriptional regulator n=1 Tax=Acidovorax sp. FG27 TaxID=3133652 RepID=UPI0030E8DAAB